MAAIFVNTSEYEATYGKKPRGFGTWAFYIVCTRGTDFNEPIMVVGKYSEARAKAIAQAKSQVGGFTGLIVGT